MAKKFQKHTLHLRKGDMDFIKSIAPRGRASELIREIVARFVENIRKQQSETEIDISDIEL